MTIPMPALNESKEDYINRCVKMIGDSPELRIEYSDKYHETLLMYSCNDEKIKAKFNQTIIQK